MKINLGSIELPIHPSEVIEYMQENPKGRTVTQIQDEFDLDTIEVMELMGVLYMRGRVWCEAKTNFGPGNRFPRILWKVRTKYPRRLSAELVRKKASRKHNRSVVKKGRAFTDHVNDAKVAANEYEKGGRVMADLGDDYE